VSAPASSATASTATARVLLVDDRPDNLLALEAVLEPLDVELVTAESGAEALIALLEREYALVVLDVQMPDMDGFETARLIKSRERTRLLPIIFLTAINGEPEHHLAGYRSGAVDYVYKPFDPEILRAKVSVFVELWHRGHLIEAQREALVEQLAAVDRLNAELERSNAVLDGFAARAAEDLLEPLDTLSGFLELLAERHIEVLGDEGALLVERAVALGDRQRARVASLLEYAEAGSATVEAKPVDLGVVLEEALARSGLRPDAASVRMLPGSLLLVCGDHSQLVRVLQLLAERAVLHASAGVVTVDAREDGPGAVVRVADDGRSPTVGELATMFDAGSPDAGFGTVIARRLVERHGGTIWAEAREPVGTAIVFTLPGEAGP
jgi:CheY-like chemotaxis protein